MNSGQRGSALLTTLVIAFVLAVAATQAGLLILRQGQLNRVAAANQVALASVERFAEEVVGNYAAIIRHDGTVNDSLFPNAPLTGTHNDLNCTFSFSAQPNALEAGIVTVDMTESCQHPIAYTRQRTLTYRLSADLRRIVAVHDSFTSRVSDHPPPQQPTLRHTGPTISNATSASFDVTTTITSTHSGYLRIILQSSDPNEALPLRHVSDATINARAALSITFTDTFTQRTGNRTVKIYYSEHPYTSPDTLRYDCTIDPSGVCGASHLHRITYTPPAGN